MMKAGGEVSTPVSVITTATSPTKAKPTTATKNIGAPFWVTFAAGGISGTVGAVITNPLEVVKTRFQSSMYQIVAADAGGVTVSFRSSPVRAAWGHVSVTLNTLKSIYTTEGITALWRGMGPTIVGVMPSRAIYFSTYSKTKHLLTGWNNDKDSSWIHLSAAVNAAVVTSTATNPIWLIKTRMQLQSNGGAKQPIYRNSFHCLQAVMKTEGVRGLYKGLTASYLGAIEGTIQWVLYEKMKKTISIHRHHLAGAEYHPSTTNQHLTWVDFFGTAASAKLIAAIFAYPHEVLRTRMREGNDKYRGLLNCASRILREEGLAAFYGGMTAHLMRTVPNSAIMFFCYEVIVHGYHRFMEKKNE